MDRMDCPVVKLFLAHLGYFGDMQNDPRVWMSYDDLLCFMMFYDDLHLPIENCDFPCLG